MSVKSSVRILDKRLTAEEVEEYLIETKTEGKTTEEWKLPKDIEELRTLLEEFNQQITHKTTNGFSNGINGSVNGHQEEEEEVVNEDILSETKSESQKNGFDKGFHPFKILGAKTDDKNELFFLVMFREDLTKADLIPNHVLHQKCPQLLIKFYEKNTLWKRF